MNMLKKLKKDEKGAALIYVIVAAAIIILLGAATTALAYANLQATKVQIISDNNFYNADAVMNAIVGGLESDMSKAYERAYSIMAAELSSQQKNPDSDKTQLKFDTVFFSEFLKLIWDDEYIEDPGFYKISHISQYVENTYSDDIRYTITALNGENILETVEGADGRKMVVLRNLHVTYEDDNGYFDEITTDIKLQAPSYDYATIQKAVQGLGLVADEGLQVNSNCALNVNSPLYLNELDKETSKLYNNVFLGGVKDRKTMNGNVIFLDTKASLTVQTKPQKAIWTGESTVAKANTANIIAGGEIYLGKESSLIIAGDGDIINENDSLKNIYSTEMWTENIILDRYASLNFAGDMYVYDDLEINGTKGNVKLAGKYYGYNNGFGAKESSAINVNGAHVTLDLSNLKELWIAGSSYIATTTIGDSDHVNNTDIMTGEAFSVKSNQLAYLLDDKDVNDPDVNVGENRIYKFVSNPMSYSQFSEMCTDNGNWTRIVSLLKSRPTAFNPSKTYGDYHADFMHIFNNLDEKVYIYVVFDDPDYASEYFNDMTKGNTLTAQRLRTYAEQYIEKFTINENTKIFMNSNYVRTKVTDITTADGLTEYNNKNIQTIIPGTDSGYTSKDTGLGYSQDAAGTDETERGKDNDFLLIQKDYYIGNSGISLEQAREDFLGDKTTSAYTSASESIKYKYTFDKMINREQVTKLLRFASTDKAAEYGLLKDVTNQEIQIIPGTIGSSSYIILKGTSNEQAIIVDNEGGKPFVIKEPGRGLIIATGDVELQADWTGCFIVGGRVTCTGGNSVSPVSFTYDENVAINASGLYCVIKENNGNSYLMAVANLFRGRENDDTIFATLERGANKNNISNCISFTHWDRD